MITNRLHIEDITSIGTFGILKVEMPSFASIASAKSLVSYVKKAYPRKDGLTYFCRTESDVETKKFWLYIGTVRKDSISRKMTIKQVKEVMV